MSKYKPIEISQKYVESVLKDEEGKQIAETVFNGINQIAIMLETAFLIPQDELILELLKVAACKSVAHAEKSVKETLQAFAKAKKDQGIDILPHEMVDMFLIPFAFEIWQKNKVVLNICDDILEFAELKLPCPATFRAMLNLPQVFWINPVSSFTNSEDITGTLVLIGCKENPPKEENGSVSSDIYVMGWSFSADDPDKYVCHMTSFNVIEEKDKIGYINIIPKNSIDSNFIYFVSSFLGIGLFCDEMTDLSKKTYKIPNPNSKPKNRFSEVCEYNIHVSDDIVDAVKKAENNQACVTTIS